MGEQGCEEDRKSILLCLSLARRGHETSETRCLLLHQFCVFVCLFVCFLPVMLYPQLSSVISRFQLSLSQLCLCFSPQEQVPSLAALRSSVQSRDGFLS